MTDVAAALECVQIGRVVRFSKTVSESDVYLFAGITGDLSPNHVNDEYMKGTPYGRRIAHGALMIGYMSAASTKLVEEIPYPIVSYGYDRVRFVRPCFLGDTIGITYKVVEKVPEKAQIISEVTVTNQNGEVVTVANHIMKFV